MCSAFYVGVNGVGEEGLEKVQVQVHVACACTTWVRGVLRIFPVNPVRVDKLYLPGGRALCAIWAYAAVHRPSVTHCVVMFTWAHGCNGCPLTIIVHTTTSIASKKRLVGPTVLCAERRKQCESVGGNFNQKKSTQNRQKICL